MGKGKWSGDLWAQELLPLPQGRPHPHSCLCKGWSPWQQGQSGSLLPNAEHWGYRPFVIAIWNNVTMRGLVTSLNLRPTIIMAPLFFPPLPNNSRADFFCLFWKPPSHSFFLFNMASSHDPQCKINSYSVTNIGSDSATINWASTV